MEAIEAFNQPLTRSAAIPAMKGLFAIDDKLKPLSEEKMEHFVSVVMKLFDHSVFMHKIIEVHRVRLDQITTSFAFPTIHN